MWKALVPTCASRYLLASEPPTRFNSEEIFKLHEGLKINIKETINDWSLIELSNGSEGWVPTISFRKIK